MQNEPLSDISLSQFNKREIKILPGFTHLRTTSAIRFICQKNGIQILNYLDDLAGCEEEHYCNFAFDFLGKLLQDCGIEESVDKACPPSDPSTYNPLNVCHLDR
jgi:hypothetical protein